VGFQGGRNNIRMPNSTRFRRALAFAAAAMLIAGLVLFANYLEKDRSEQFARDAWAHFSTRCEKDSGEQVYETFPHVSSVVVLKPLPPASDRDLSDQFWYGDPYSNATAAKDRAERVASALLGTVRFAAGLSQRGFDFVEIPAADESGGGFLRITLANDSPERVSQRTNSLASRFAAVWEDISTPEDRKYWVAGSRLRIIDLLTESLVAERVGYLIEPGSVSWTTARVARTTCPAVVNGTYHDRGFVLSVLRHGEP
jgi:hypothetical protein